MIWRVQLTFITNPDEVEVNVGEVISHVKSAGWRFIQAHSNEKATWQHARISEDFASRHYINSFFQREFRRHFIIIEYHSLSTFPFFWARPLCSYLNELDHCTQDRIINKTNYFFVVFIIV